MNSYALFFNFMTKQLKKLIKHIYDILSPGFVMPRICFTSLKTKCVINLNSIVIKHVAYYRKY